MNNLIVFVLCFSTIFCTKLEDEAETCTADKCKIENNCRCSSNRNPLPNVSEAPQLIAITVSESIVENSYNDYLKQLFVGRKNPDGRNVGVTFFVPHKYTDYTLVNELYRNGFEIGSFSITLEKNDSQEYWRTAPLDTLVNEFKGQAEIISKFANIPIDDIKGGRTPQLQLQGDVTIDALITAGLIYDNSWPTLSTKLLFPYTLDYASTQQYTVKCPQQGHPGFWIIPLTNIRGPGDNAIECSSLAACGASGTAQEISEWLLDQINKVRSGLRTPLVLRLDTYWFSYTEYSLEGLTMFLDKLQSLPDVFLVNVNQITEWVKNPVPVENFTTDTHERYAECDRMLCRYNFQEATLNMFSCVPCPDEYPWIGNPSGDAE